MNQTHAAGFLAELDQADFQIGPEDLQPDPMAVLFNDMADQMPGIARRLSTVWCAGAMALLFRTHPWIQSIRLELRREGEYDDEGGTYMSSWVNVEEVTAVEGATLPEGALEEGRFSSDFAADLLEQEAPSWEDELCSAFIGGYSYGEAQATLVVDRHAFDELAKAGITSARAVALAVWPSYFS